MKTHLAVRAAALGFALAITLAMLGGIDGLATLEKVHPHWAAAIAPTTCKV